MRCVVGLGNPGSKYEGTFHNVGFDAVRLLERRIGGFQTFSKFDAQCWKGNLNGSGFLLMLPQTFMNLSGKSLVACKNFFKLSDSDFLVVCDDLNLPLGSARFREGGSGGGHNGLGDIIRCFSSNAFPRVRVGIGRPERKEAVRGYVLSKIPPDASEILSSVYDSLVDPLKKFIANETFQIPSSLSPSGVLNGS